MINIVRACFEPPPPTKNGYEIFKNANSFIAHLMKLN